MFHKLYISACFLAAATLTAGETQAEDAERIFKKCAACHSFDPEKRKPGPHLQGVLGRPAASVDGFRYSKSMQASGLTWDRETFRAFLANPKVVVPKTKMSFRGIKKDEDLDRLLDYLAER